MTGRPLRWLLLGGAVAAALLLGVLLRARHATQLPAPRALDTTGEAAEPAIASASADDAVGLPPEDGGAVPEGLESPFDEPNAWASVDLEAARRAMPDNIYWRMSAPTKDEDVLRARAEERARWNEAYGKVLSNTATEQEIDAYYAHRDRLASDYVQFATYILENHGAQLTIRDLGLPPGCIVISVERGLVSEVPTADFTLVAGDRMSVLVSPRAADAVHLLRDGTERGSAHAAPTA